MDKLLPTSPVFRKFQRMHFYFFDVLLFIVFLFCVYMIPTLGLRTLDLVLFVFWWTLGVIGIEIGLHRYFSHRSFEASEGFKKFLIILASMGGQGRVVSWATAHRYHHERSDQEDDLHSPYLPNSELSNKNSFQRFFLRLNKFIYSHIGWKFDYRMPNPYLYGQDLIKDQTIKTYSQFYILWFLLGLVLPGIVQFMFTFQLRDFYAGIVWGGVIRAYLGQNMTWTVNSICHLFGVKKYPSSDNSRNIQLFSLPTLGGSLHNNHHYQPRAFTTRLSENDFDPAFYILKGFEKLGWVKNLVYPQPQEKKVENKV